MTTARIPPEPVIAPRNGLRQRWLERDRCWRVWWEPTPAERKAGAAPVDLTALRPGDAQRRADTLKAQAQARLRKGADPKVAARAGQHGVSVDRVIADYRASRHFTDRAENTRRVYAHDMGEIAATWGPQAVDSFTPPVLDAWYDRLLQTRGPFRARALCIMLSILFLHAERRGWRPVGSNPVAPLAMVVPPKRSRAGTWAELDACLQAARRLGLRSMRAAILLVIFGGGQRQTDVRLARQADFARVPLLLTGMTAPRPFVVWSLTRNKRGNDGRLVINPTAAPAIRLQLRRAAALGPDTPLIFDEATGRGMTPRLFAARWDTIRAEAAKTVPSVASLQWRDLRRTFARLARAAGASREDVGDAIGNSAATNDTLYDTYMGPQLETAARATLALRRPAAPAGTTPARKRAG